MTDRIPEEIKIFIMEHIDSVAEIEGLLLLRANSTETWNVQKLAERLYIEESEAGKILGRLLNAGFLQSPSAHVYIYQPATDDLALRIDIVAQNYTRLLVPITNLIHSRHKTRVQEFANAFRIRKDT